MKSIVRLHQPAVHKCAALNFFFFPDCVLPVQSDFAAYQRQKNIVLDIFFISKTHRTVFVNEWNSNVFVSNILFTIFLSYYHKQNSCHSAELNPGNFRSSIAPYRGTFKENKLSLLSSSTWFSATELDTRSSLVHAVETSSRGEYFGVSEQRGPTSWRCNFLAV